MAPARDAVRVDPGLALALLLGLALCLHGSAWGRLEHWNPDQMALRTLFGPGRWPFQPESYLKPPFHTYLNFLVAEGPARAISLAVGTPRDALVIWLSRLLTLGLFLGTVSIVFLIVRDAFHAHVARVVAVLFATSAGIIPFALFLTADVPVLFWMLASFRFAQKILTRPSPTHYVCAGALVGVATATKYNGLAIGFALVAAHALSARSRSLREVVLDRRLALGLAAVPIAFVLACPYAILDARAFVSDFLLNYEITPVYSGRMTGTSFGDLVRFVGELIGVHGLALATVGLVLALRLVVRPPRPLDARTALVVMALSVTVPYVIKFGSFPRLEDRFILPIVPYLLVLSALTWDALRRWRGAFLALLVVTLTYNVACSYHVGRRFLGDPRMAAQRWAVEHVPPGARLLRTEYAPTWRGWPRLPFGVVSLPTVSGRTRLFSARFAPTSRGRAEVVSREARERDDQRVRAYRQEHLQELGPDFIAVSSLYYQRFLDWTERELYPEMRSFFDDLLAERYAYRIVFDRASPAPPRWAYPRHIDFVEGHRLVILARVR